jgi:putative chitinase
MRASEFLKEFIFPDVGGKIYDLTHPASGPNTQRVAPVSAGPKLGPTTPPTVSPAPAPKMSAATEEPAPFNPASYRDLIIKLARQRGFSNDSDVSKLLGQINHETEGWKKPVEVMHYSTPERIKTVFTHAFQNLKDTIPYINNPVALANKVYANVNGNGDEASGDGWRYRGRGFLHISGKGNYKTAGEVTHPDNPMIYINNPVLLSANPTESAISAIEYFKKTVGLGKTTRQVSKKINSRAGGTKREKATNIELNKLKADRSGKQSRSG